MKRYSYTYSSKKSGSSFIIPVIIICVIAFIVKMVSDGKMYFKIKKGTDDNTQKISENIDTDMQENNENEDEYFADTDDNETEADDNGPGFRFSSALAEEIYNTACSSLNEFKTSIHFESEKEYDTDTLEEAVKEAIGIIRKDDPEYFWAGGCSYVLGKNYTDINFEEIFDLSGKKISEMNAELQKAADDIINKIPDNSSDYEKALFVHDSIIDSTVYDLAGRDSDINGSWGTAYGCLVENKAICQGYACAYKLIMDKLGIECGIVSGYGKNARHAWNYIRLGGRYYWVDLTWDDPLTDDGTQMINHKYCFLDDRFLNDHTPGEGNLFIPQCGSMKYNYYKYNRRYVESYSFDRINKILSSCEGEEYADIMFGSSEAADECINDLFENKKIWETDHFRKMETRSTSHSYDPDLHTLKIWL